MSLIIRGNLDKRAEFTLRKVHEATSMAIRASAAASLVSRAAKVWMRKIIQFLSNNNCLS